MKHENYLKLYNLATSIFDKNDIYGLYVGYKARKRPMVDFLLNLRIGRFKVAKPRIVHLRNDQSLK